MLHTSSKPVPKGNYAFIDGQNLYLGVSSLGWKLDYRKFRLFLKHKYSVVEAMIFLGQMDRHQSLYRDLKKMGYTLRFKQTIRYFQDGKQTIKGNVDAELVLHAAAIQYDHYDKAVLVTGDGDFACLADFLVQHSKLQCIVTPNGFYSKLLQQHSGKIVRIELM